MSPTAPMVETLVSPAAHAQRQLATDDGAIDGLDRAHGDVQTAVATYDTDAGRQTRALQADWHGSSADRQASDAASMSGAAKDISTYSADVQGAVREAAGILKVGQSTNQRLIDDFMDRAAELLSAAAALRQAGDNAGAQRKISELIRLGAQVSGDSSTNLQAVMSQLTGVVTRLDGADGQTSASSADGGRGSGNSAPFTTLMEAFAPPLRTSTWPSGATASDIGKSSANALSVAARNSANFILKTFERWASGGRLRRL